MDLNHFATQLHALLTAAYSKPVTLNLMPGIDEAETQGAGNEFMESIVEEICSYPQIDALTIWTRQVEALAEEKAVVSLVIEIRSKQPAAIQPRTKSMRELSVRLQAVGGVLHLLPASGRGMRYELIFPARVVQRAAGGGGETILLVEDEDFLRKVTAEVLQNCGYRVLAAKDAGAAFELFTSNGRVDLLLADVMLPGESGTDLARRLSESQPRLNIILMSGYSAFEGQEPRQAAIAYLQKPFSVESLLNKIQEVLEPSILPGTAQLEAARPATLRR